MPQAPTPVGVSPAAGITPWPGVGTPSWRRPSDPYAPAVPPWNISDEMQRLTQELKDKLALDDEDNASLTTSEPTTGLANFLVPLLGEWQSVMLGHIQLRRRIGVNEFDSDSLDVWRPGDTSPMGIVSVSGDSSPACPVVLEVFTKTQKSRWLWLAAQHCKRTRTIWENKTGEITDCWDSDLIRCARNAAVWVESQRGLLPHFEKALAGIVGGAIDESTLTDSPHSVALCISTMNRLWQLRRALPLNLLHAWPHRRWVKIHVVDFGSSDGTLDFLLKRCHAAVDCGLLCVYRTDQMKWWHASIAKNTTHMVAEEDIVVNLDGDNLTGPDFAVHVVRQFVDEGCTVVQYEDGEGTCGRIATWRSDFHKIRGYDEDAYPMGAQDVDLIKRIQSLPGGKFKKVRNTEFSQAIPNSQEMKVACCDPTHGGLRWGRMDTFNREMFKLRRDNGQVTRNLHQENIGLKVWRADSNFCKPKS